MQLPLQGEIHELPTWKSTRFPAELCCNDYVNVGGADAGLSNLDPQTLRTLALALPGMAETPLPSAYLEVAPDIISLSLGGLAATPIQNLLQAVEEIVAQSLPREIVSSRTVQPTVGPRQSSELIVREAKVIAEKSIAKAAHAIEMAADRPNGVPAHLDPQSVLSLANQFVETGQLTHHLRATELGRVVFSWYEKPVPSSGPIAGRSAVRPRPARFLKYLEHLVAHLWRRAPVLVLLIGWLLFGAIPALLGKLSSTPAGEFALAFEIWATGFLGLVVVQFVVTIRGFLSRRRRF